MPVALTVSVRGVMFAVVVAVVLTSDVVARVGPRDRDAGHRHRLAGAHVLVGEGGRGVGIGEACRPRRGYR